MMILMIMIVMTIFIARFISGVAVNVAVSIVPGYIIDIASPQNQSIMGLLVNLLYRLRMTMTSEENDVRQLMTNDNGVRQ